MDGVDYAGICDLARDVVLGEIHDLIHDRMGQGEALEDKGFLGNLIDDDRDNEVFGAYESYLVYLHNAVQNTPIPLEVHSPV